MSVKISFRINGEKSSTQTRRTFDESNCEPVRLGLSEGRTPIKVSESAESYRHIIKHTVSVLNAFLHNSLMPEIILIQACMIMVHYQLQEKEGTWPC